ncbi:hypothetical protein BHM03_00019308 [Ensete ventricosum]|nr:hypothetical protein BHM03_00019308 [Ensete ventricosum]
MQRQEWLLIQGVNAMVPQRWVFRVCASKLASDESLGHQHMGAMYHRGRSQIVCTSESHGGDLIIQRWSKGVRKRRRVQWVQLPKSKASVRKEVDSEDHHNAAEADLPIAKEGM